MIKSTSRETAFAAGSRNQSEPRRIGEVLPDFFAQNPKLAARLADYRDEQSNEEAAYEE